MDPAPEGLGKSDSKRPLSNKLPSERKKKRTVLRSVLGTKDEGRKVVEGESFAISKPRETSIVPLRQSESKTSRRVPSVELVKKETLKELGRGEDEEEEEESLQRQNIGEIEIDDECQQVDVKMSEVWKEPGSKVRSTQLDTIFGTIEQVCLADPFGEVEITTNPARQAAKIATLEDGKNLPEAVTVGRKKLRRRKNRAAKSIIGPNPTSQIPNTLGCGNKEGAEEVSGKNSKGKEVARGEDPKNTKIKDVGMPKDVPTKRRHEGDTDFDDGCFLVIKPPFELRDSMTDVKLSDALFYSCASRDGLALGTLSKSHWYLRFNTPEQANELAGRQVIFRAGGNLKKDVSVELIPYIKDGPKAYLTLHAGPKSELKLQQLVEEKFPGEKYWMGRRLNKGIVLKAKLLVFEKGQNLFAFELGEKSGFVTRFKAVRRGKNVKSVIHHMRKECLRVRLCLTHQCIQNYLIELRDGLYKGRLFSCILTFFFIISNSHLS